MTHCQLAAPQQRLKLVLPLYACHLQPLVVLHSQQARHIHVECGHLCGGCRAVASMRGSAAGQRG
jgi:hypothetical protein